MGGGGNTFVEREDVKNIQNIMGGGGGEGGDLKLRGNIHL